MTNAQLWYRVIE